jgi:hypothetical protein
MKWTLKDLQLVHIQHRQIDGVWKSRTVTTWGDAEVTLDEEGITEMAHRALSNKTGRARQGHFKAKAITRHTEATEWEAK